MSRPLRTDALDDRCESPDRFKSKLRRSPDQPREKADIHGM